MVIILEPMEDSCSVMLCLLPCPMATMAMTAATPMMMPSMVRKARSLFRWSARKATRMRFNGCISLSIVVRNGKGSQGLPGVTDIFVLKVLLYFSVPQHDGAAAEGGDIRLVGYEDDGLTLLV